MTELKSCPFCGGKAVIQEHEFFYPDKLYEYGVTCAECKSQTWQFFKDKEEAIEAWNRRAR